LRVTALRGEREAAPLAAAELMTAAVHAVWGGTRRCHAWWMASRTDDSGIVGATFFRDHGSGAPVRARKWAGVGCGRD
jgi:hypothetical protein